MKKEKKDISNAVKAKPEDSLNGEFVKFFDDDCYVGFEEFCNNVFGDMFKMESKGGVSKI